MWIRRVQDHWDQTDPGGCGDAGGSGRGVGGDGAGGVAASTGARESRGRSES